MSELATHILQSLAIWYKVGWSVTNGDVFLNMKMDDPTVVEPYHFPYELDAVLRELAQAKYIEKHPTFSEWKILKLSL